MDSDKLYLQQPAPPPPPPSPYQRNIATDVITPFPNFTPVTLDANLELVDTSLLQFFGTTGMNVNTIVLKVTNCQEEIFKAQRDYIPRAMYRFTNLQALIAVLTSDPGTVPDLLQINVMADAPGSTLEEKMAWATAKIQNVITNTIADIAGQAVTSMVNVAQNCNDAHKNLYRYLYHRYSQYNNDIILLATSFF